MDKALNFFKRYPALVVGGTLFGLAVLMALLAPLLGTTDPIAISPARRLRDPSALYWFGTDLLGRDVYSRVVYGARVSLIVGVTVAALTAVIGCIVGVVSGYVKALDAIIMRILDGIMSIPSILLAITMVALWRGSLTNVIIAITIAETPRMARLVRGVVLVLRTQTYIEAATAAGNSTLRIVMRHVLPGTIPAVTVQATYVCAAAMIIEAVLSFLGAGTPSEIPSWGNIMAEGRTLWQLKPHLVMTPAFFLSLTILGVNLLGNGLRDALDPRFVTRG